MVNNSKVKLPKYVRISGVTYNVYSVDGFADDSNMAGVHKGFASEIKVDYTMARQRILETFIHEIIHATDFTCFGYILEEEHVNFLAKAWLQIFIDNNLQLNNDKVKLPKKVRVGPFEYEIVFPHSFRDLPSITALSVKYSELSIFLTDKEGDELYRMDFIKLNLFSAICLIIINTYQNEENKVPIDFKIISGALFQVFKKNKIEELVKKYW